MRKLWLTKDGCGSNDCYNLWAGKPRYLDYQYREGKGVTWLANLNDDEVKKFMPHLQLNFGDCIPVELKREA